MASSPAHNPRPPSDLVYDCRPLHWEAQDLPDTTRPAEHNPAPPQPESDESRRGMRAHTVRRKDRGQAIVEYAAVIALIGVCLVAILSLVGNATKKASNERARRSTATRASPPAAAREAPGEAAVCMSFRPALRAPPTRPTTLRSRIRKTPTP